MAKGFEAEDKKFVDVLFSEKCFYRVPQYQRPYTWEKDQLQQLWSDIYETGDTTFIGSFVFNKEYLETEKCLEIIDGQQRILTFTIVMAAMRDVAEKIGASDLSKRIQRKAIAHEDFNGKLTYKVICGDSLRDFFEINIQKGEANKYLNFRERDKMKFKGERAEVIDNYIYAYNELIFPPVEKENTSDKKAKILEEMWEKIRNLDIIWIEIESDLDAYKIFETVNARGVDLTVADLLKNLIFKYFSGRKVKEIDVAKNQWSLIASNIEETNTKLSTFMRQDWVSKNDIVGEKKLYGEIRSKIKNYGDYLTELTKTSYLYNAILLPNKKYWKEMYGPRVGVNLFNILMGIKAMDVTQCYVLFLSLLGKEKDIEFRLDDFLGVVENFSFQYSAVCHLQANKVDKIYSKTANEITRVLLAGGKHKEKNLNRVLETLKTELRKLLPKKEFFISQFCDLQYKKTETKRILLKYILSKINNQMSSAEFDLDFDVISLEHILPQDPTEWGLEKNDVKEYVHNIGNLTLISSTKNSEIGNEKLTEKCKKYFDTQVHMTKELAQTISDNKFKWNEEEIKQRAKALAEFAYEKVWNFK